MEIFRKGFDPTAPFFGKLWTSVGQIFGYLDKYIHLSKYLLIFSEANILRTFIHDLFILTNIFGYSFVQYL